MQEAIKIVHQGRGGYLEFDGCRYGIEHVEGGSFAIFFPDGNRHGNLQDHLEKLHAFAEGNSPKWFVENRSKNYAIGQDL